MSQIAQRILGKNGYEIFDTNFNTAGTEIKNIEQHKYLQRQKIINHTSKSLITYIISRITSICN